MLSSPTLLVGIQNDSVTLENFVVSYEVKHIIPLLGILHSLLSGMQQWFFIPLGLLFGDAMFVLLFLFAFHFLPKWQGFLFTRVLFCLPHFSWFQSRWFQSCHLTSLGVKLYSTLSVMSSHYVKCVLLLLCVLLAIN